MAAMQSLTAAPQFSKIDINTATRRQLAHDAGLGAGRAESILIHREATGGIKSLDELARLPRFRDLQRKEFDRLIERLTVG